MVNGRQEEEGPSVELLATFPRTPREEVRVSIVREEGKSPKVDLRLWWRLLGEEGEEEWRPTRRGVRLLVSALPKLIRTLQKASKDPSQRFPGGPG